MQRCVAFRLSVFRQRAAGDGSGGLSQQAGGGDAWCGSAQGMAWFMSMGFSNPVQL